MRQIFPLIFGSLMILALTGCQEETKTTNVELNFKSYFSQDPLLMYEADYDYAEDMKMRFQLFHFYISDVALLTADGEEKLLDVELVTFKDVQTQDQAQDGVSFLIENIPTGNYQGIRMTIGLTEELNATQPSDYVAGHPLSDNYWSWALGYIFFKIEGNGDLNGQGTFDEKLTYHIGGDVLANVKTFNKDITLEQGQDAQLFFEVDVKDILTRGSEFVDFRTTPQDHTNDMNLAHFMADNFYDALIMK